MLISSNTKYNDSSRSIAHVGYMYGEVNNFNDKSLDSSYLFGSSFTYANGTYTLQSTQDSTDSTHHYTCFNTTGTCSEVYYIYYTYPYTPYMSTYYVTLTNGKSVEDLINDALVNTSESTIKTKLDDWFINTFATSFTNLGKNYNDYLEDTVWCNDRSINEVSSDVFSSFEESGWNPNGGETTGSGSKSHALNFGIIGRLLTGTPTLTCPNKKDAFTVNNSTNGNSLLSYPVGTLTADEVMLAGGQYNIYDDNVRNYLKSGWSWWTLSPSTYYGFYGTSNARILMVSASGNLYAEGTESAIGLRPSISIVPSIKIATGGDGSAVNPYKFLID